MTDAKDVYQETIARLEPDIAMIDPGAFYASAAISLKRIADVLEREYEGREARRAARVAYYDDLLAQIKTARAVRKWWELF